MPIPHNNKKGDNTMRIEVLVDVKTTLGEGPVWDVEQQRLYWIDSADGRILRCTEDGRELRAWDVGQKIGSMALRHSGEQAIVALQNGVHLLDLNSGELALVIDPEPALPTGPPMMLAKHTPSRKYPVARARCSRLNQ